MKQNAKSDKPFTLNAYVLERVNEWEAPVSGQKQKFICFYCKNVNFTGKIVKQLGEVLHKNLKPDRYKLYANQLLIYISKSFI